MISIPDFPYFFVPDVLSSSAASDKALLGSDPSPSSKTATSALIQSPNPWSIAFLRSLVAGVDDGDGIRVPVKFIQAINSSSLSSIVRPNSSPVAAERARTFSTARRASFIGIVSDLSAWPARRFGGELVDFGHFLDFRNRRGNRNFILTPDGVVALAMGNKYFEKGQRMTRDKG